MDVASKCVRFKQCTGVHALSDRDVPCSGRCAPSLRRLGARRTGTYKELQHHDCASLISAENHSLILQGLCILSSSFAVCIAVLEHRRATWAPCRSSGTALAAACEAPFRQPHYSFRAQAKGLRRMACRRWAKIQWLGLERGTCMGSVMQQPPSVWSSEVLDGHQRKAWPKYEVRATSLETDAAHATQQSCQPVVRV